MSESNLSRAHSKNAISAISASKLAPTINTVMTPNSDAISDLSSNNIVLKDIQFNNFNDKDLLNQLDEEIKQTEESMK